MIVNKLRKYLEDNIHYEAERLKMAVELDDQIHRGANLSTFRRMLHFLEAHNVQQSGNNSTDENSN